MVKDLHHLASSIQASSDKAEGMGLVPTFANQPNLPRVILFHTHCNKYGDDTKKVSGGGRILKHANLNTKWTHVLPPIQPCTIKLSKKPAWWFTKGRNTVLNSLLNKPPWSFLSKEPKSSKVLQNFPVGHVGTWFIQQTFAGHRSLNGLLRIYKMDSNIPSRRPGFDSWVGKISCRRAWQPTPIFLPGESHGRRSLEGYSP